MSCSDREMSDLSSTPRDRDKGESLISFEHMCLARGGGWPTVHDVYARREHCRGKVLRGAFVHVWAAFWDTEAMYNEAHDTWHSRTRPLTRRVPAVGWLLPEGHVGLQAPVCTIRGRAGSHEYRTYTGSC